MPYATDEITRRELDCRQQCPGCTAEKQPRGYKGFRGGRLTVYLALFDGVADSFGALSIHLASDAKSRTKHFLNCTLEILRERLESHSPGYLDYFIEADRLVVLDVFLLLAVSWWLLQSLDDKGRGSRNHRNGGLAVLNRESDRDAEAFLFFESSQPDTQKTRASAIATAATYPVTRRLGDIFSHLLGRQSQGTDLGSKS
jgi:hypothetical protein